MHRKRLVGKILALGLLAALLTTGCGAKTEQIGEAMALLETMDYQGALELFAQAQENKENQRLIHRGMGIAYFKLSEYDQAIQCFLDALSGSNGLVEDMDYDVNYYLAAAYSRSGRYQEAKEVYDSILALKPEEENAYFMRANAELALDQYTAAKEDFDKVVAMDPANYDRLFSIYESFAQYGYKTAGQEYLETALEDGEKSLSDFEKGRIYFYLEDYPKAYVALEEAKNDGTAQSSLYLGKAYEATGDYNYACNVYRSYLEKSGDSAEMYNQLGICEMKRMNIQAALDAFQAGLALQDKSMHQTLSYNEMVAYEKLGDFNKAAELVRAYLKLYPEDSEAQRELDFLSTREHTTE